MTRLWTSKSFKRQITELKKKREMFIFIQIETNMSRLSCSFESFKFSLLVLNILVRYIDS